MEHKFKINDEDFEILTAFTGTIDTVQHAQFIKPIAKDQLVGLIRSLKNQVLTKTAAKGIVAQTLYKLPNPVPPAFDLTKPAKSKDDLINLFLTMTMDRSKLNSGETVVIPHALIDPATILQFPLFAEIVPTGANDGERLRSAREMGMAMLLGYTAGQMGLNQVTVEDLSRVTAHTSYQQLANASAASKYIPGSGLAAAALSISGKEVSGSKANVFAALVSMSHWAAAWMLSNREAFGEIYRGCSELINEIRLKATKPQKPKVLRDLEELSHARFLSRELADVLETHGNDPTKWVGTPDGAVGDLHLILSGAQNADVRMRLQCKNNVAFASTRPADYAYLAANTPALKKRSNALR